MKIQYAISIDDFRALQTPLIGRAGANAGFKGAIVACFLMAALGVFCIVQGLGLPVGAFLIGLGALAGIASYFFDVRAVRRAKEKYETNVLVAFQRLHCRDHRAVEFNDSGFTLSCKCGVVTRPWSELAQFSENDKFFLLRTKVDGLLLPKSAFSSEGDRTEFRRLATDQINNNRAFASRPIEYVCTAGERRSARLLHIVRGGGWRLALRVGVTLAGTSYLLNLYLRLEYPSYGPALPFLAAGLVLLAFFVAVIVRSARTKSPNRAPLYVHFGEEGLHLQDQTTIARNSWESFCGYLENESILLLYYNPRLYRVIPKRALASREAEFRGLVFRKLSHFDYRNPVRVANTQVSKPA